jgi:hypothetical protein
MMFVLAFEALGADTDPFVELDQNRNHLVEEREAQAAGRRVFGNVDANSDGLLQPNEIAGRLGGPVQKAADTDADGVLNFQEYAALLTASSNIIGPRPVGKKDKTVASDGASSFRRCLCFSSLRSFFGHWTVPASKFQKSIYDAEELGVCG